MDVNPIKIPGFSNLIKIGQGGNSLVYAGTSVSDKKDVVIKLKINKKNNNKFSYIVDESIYGIREYDIGNNFSCDFIAKYIKYNCSKFYIYTLMEREESSMTAYKNEIILPYTEKVSLLKKILIGLDTCHNNGILHLDMKFENVLMRTRLKEDVLVDEPLITDFGFSIRVRSVKSGVYIKRSFGTLGYFAPEQHSEYHHSNNVTDRYIYKGSIDIWTFGVIAFRLLFNERIYKGDFDKETIYRDMVTYFKNGTVREFVYQIKSDLFESLDKKDQEDIIELLTSTLRWNHNERLNTTQLLMLPIFQKSSKVSINCTLNKSRKFIIIPNDVTHKFLEKSNNIAMLVPNSPAIVYYHMIDILYRICSVKFRRPLSSDLKYEEICLSCLIISLNYNIQYNFGAIDDYIQKNNIKIKILIDKIVYIITELKYTIARPYLYESARSINDMKNHVKNIIPYPERYSEERDIVNPNPINVMDYDYPEFAYCTIKDILSDI